MMIHLLSRRSLVTLCVLFLAILHVPFGSANALLSNQAGKGKLYIGDLIKALGKTKQANGFSEIAALIEKNPTILDLLLNEKNITFFAPTNLAIRNRGDLSPESLLDILKYHIVIGDVGNYKTAPLVNVVDTALSSASNLVKLPGKMHQKLVILNDNRKNLAILFGSNLPAITLQDAFQCINGKIFPINTLLLPPINPVVTASLFGLNLFMESLARAALTSEYLGTKGLTFFVPKTEALQDYIFRHPKMRVEQLAYLLRHHACKDLLYTNLMADGMVVQSDAKLNLTISSEDGINFAVNRIPIITPNIITSNGVIHIIDGLLNPFKQRAGSQQINSPSEEAKHENKVDRVDADDDQDSKFDTGDFDHLEDDLDVEINKHDIPLNPKDDGGKVKKDLIDSPPLSPPISDDLSDTPTEGNRRIVADARSGSDVFNANPASTCALFSIVIASILGLYM